VKEEKEVDTELAGPCIIQADYEGQDEEDEEEEEEEVAKERKEVKEEPRRDSASPAFPVGVKRPAFCLDLTTSDEERPAKRPRSLVRVAFLPI
jgi:hypothetical protein